MEKLIAPWTSEQVDALNRYQTESRMHPFTCLDHHLLVASHSGWYCTHPTCDYVQDWAHPFMANPDSWPVFPWDNRIVVGS